MINIIVWILFGALAGWIASLLTQNEGSLTRDISIGILGALMGGLIVRALGGVGVNDLNMSGLFVSVMGAIILLLGARSVNRG